MNPVFGRYKSMAQTGGVDGPVQRDPMAAKRAFGWRRTGVIYFRLAHLFRQGTLLAS
jgi:hypothetical protein